MDDEEARARDGRDGCRAGDGCVGVGTRRGRRERGATTPTHEDEEEEEEKEATRGVKNNEGEEEAFVGRPRRVKFRDRAKRGPRRSVV